MQALFGAFTERWDGKGEPNGLGGEEIPLSVRIVHVARDATFHRMVGGVDAAVGVVRERAGGAFDPGVVAALADEPGEILADDEGASVWDATLAAEPGGQLALTEDGDRSRAGRDGRLRRSHLALAGRALRPGWPS